VKIGKNTIPHTAISTANEDAILVRGFDLAHDLIGKISFADYFFLLVAGRVPSAAASRVLNATLVAIAEHGLVPSVQASRMTLAAAPDALQGAVAAGILGCGSVILGSSEKAGVLLANIKAQCDAGAAIETAVDAAITDYTSRQTAIPGYGHPMHKDRDPRVGALFDVARSAKIDLTYVNIAELVESSMPRLVRKNLRLNVSAAIPAVLLGIGFPLKALKGVPILGRTAGLIAHLSEESERPIGFALSYQATRDTRYDGDYPAEPR
jgi:citrate synthase